MKKANKRKKVLAWLVASTLSLSCQAQHGWAAAEFMSLSDCPAEYGDYSAKVIVEDYALVEVKVYFNGSLLQVLRPEKDEETLAMPIDPADNLIHFPDANNDGYRDIYVGPGGSRTFNTLFLWNPQSNRFERCKTEDNLQNILFCPQEDCIYVGGSNSAWEFSVTRSEWKGNELRQTATLDITQNLADYNRQADPKYKKTHSYVLTEKNGSVTKTNNPTKLPVRWQRAMNRILNGM